MVCLVALIGGPTNEREIVPIPINNGINICIIKCLERSPFIDSILGITETFKRSFKGSVIPWPGKEHEARIMGAVNES